jgi:anti-sigma28 factor (negative regulator of flagellin synthesis)
VTDKLVINAETGESAVVPLTIEEQAEYDANVPVAVEFSRVAEIRAAIKALEMQVTPRRLRDAVLTEEGKAWLQNIEDQIAVERAKI